VLKGVVLLVLACPCSIVLAAPVPSVSAIATAARHGVLLRGPAVVEQMCDVTDVATDKTGTLTTGSFRARHQADISDQDDREGDYDPLLLAAALERKSAHPLASAVVEAYVLILIY